MTRSTTKAGGQRAGNRSRPREAGAHQRERFKEWVWSDDARRERLCRLYNDTFNHTRVRTFNGDHLTLPGASGAIQLHGHQKAGVWRILQTPNTLLAHVVGAGIMPRAGLCRVDPSSPGSGVPVRFFAAA